MKPLEISGELSYQQMAAIFCNIEFLGKIHSVFLRRVMDSWEETGKYNISVFLESMTRSVQLF